MCVFFFFLFFFFIYQIKLGKTCSEIKLYNPHATSGSYVIDPDGDGSYEPFTVHCDMTDKNGVGVTVVGHDSENRTLVKGYESRGSYVRDINYTGTGLTSNSQLFGLLNISTHCEQFIKYECYHTVLLYNGDPWGWWVSRDNVKMTYWGGATPADSYKCACGVNNTCANSSLGCNCDKNDEELRNDSGLLTEKSHLPVLQLRFGDTGHSIEYGYHTLGKLKCYGGQYGGTVIILLKFHIFSDTHVCIGAHVATPTVFIQLNAALD